MGQMSGSDVCFANRNKSVNDSTFESVSQIYNSHLTITMFLLNTVQIPSSLTCSFNVTEINKDAPTVNKLSVEVWKHVTHHQPALLRPAI